MQEAIDHLKKVSTAADLVKIASDTAGTMPGYFFANNLSWVKDLVTQQQEGSSPFINWDLVNDSIGRTVDTMTHNEESYLSFLSTSAAVSPLLGLFGTVWGLVHSFVRISQQKTADIAVVAPGIAEALITTLAGLVVAIPALIIFSYIRSKKDMLH